MTGTESGAGWRPASRYHSHLRRWAGTWLWGLRMPANTSLQGVQAGVPIRLCPGVPETFLRLPHLGWVRRVPSSSDRTASTSAGSRVRARGGGQQTAGHAKGCPQVERRLPGPTGSLLGSGVSTFLPSPLSRPAHVARPAGVPGRPGPVAAHSGGSPWEPGVWTAGRAGCVFALGDRRLRGSPQRFS